MIMYMVTRHFGLKAYGALLGILFVPVKAVEWRRCELGSWLYDTSHSYELLLTIYIAGAVVASLVLLSIGRYPADIGPEQPTVR